jgi:hypothetical protein
MSIFTTYFSKTCFSVIFPYASGYYSFICLLFIGPEPAFGISTKIARGTGQVGNMRSIGSSLMDRDMLRAFLKEFLVKELENYSISARSS